MKFASLEVGARGNPPAAAPADGRRRSCHHRPPRRILRASALTASILLPIVMSSVAQYGAFPSLDASCMTSAKTALFSDAGQYDETLSMTKSGFDPKLTRLCGSRTAGVQSMSLDALAPSA